METRGTLKLYRLAFIYSAFNTGYSLVAPLRLLIQIFGIGEIINKNYLLVLIGMIFYFIFCLVVGIICFKKGWVDATNEVQNKYNPFVKEVRHKLKTKTI